MSKPPLKSYVAVAGVAETALQLRQFGDRAVDHAARQMRQVSKKIEAKAKDYVPEDSESLKDSIRVVEDRKGIRGRLRLDVIVGGAVAPWQRYRNKIEDVDLDSYATYVHENYESFVEKPSNKTLAKMARFPGKVGSGFLTRAADEEQEGLRKQLFDGIDFVTRDFSK